MQSPFPQVAPADLLVAIPLLIIGVVGTILGIVQAVRYHRLSKP